MDSEVNEDHRPPPKSKKWECGDPYQYPIPEVGDHWENLLEPLLESDKAQCDAWKDEVQNLLIFAGLFSGVLTAFVIESYPRLQPDPNDLVIALLERIATRLDNGTTSQPMDPVLSSSSPNASSMRINIFWFIGLVLSLTTVLVGIVSLQWLREHQRYPKYLSTKERFALFNMRVEGLEAWYVPQIFSALPVLLQLALVLFLVGLVDFLLPAGKEVAIPVIIAIVIPLAFLISTTILPTIQTFALLLPLWGHKLKAPQQCPYKSPQSRALRQMIDIVKRVIQAFCNSLINALEFILDHLVSLLPLPLVLAKFFKKISNELEEIDSDSEMSVFRAFGAENWLIFDAYWLSMRNACAQSIFDQDRWISEIDFHPPNDIGSLYDLTRGLIKFRLISGIPDSTIVFSKYHSVHDLTSLVEKYELAINSSDTPGRQSRYLNKLLASKFDNSTTFTTFSAVLADPTREIIRDENAFMILCNFPFFHSPPQFIAQHFAELHVRLANSMYPKTPRMLASPSLELVNYSKRYLANVYVNDQLFSKTRPVFDPVISAQLSLVIESFFQAATDPSVDDETLFASAHVRNFGGLLESAVDGQSKDAAQRTLDFLAANLNSYMDGQLGKRSDFLFYASSFYVHSLVDPYSRIYSVNRDLPAVESLLPTLRRYLQERGTPDLEFQERFGVPAPDNSDYSNLWWRYLDSTVEEDKPYKGDEPVISIDPPDLDILPSHHDSTLESTMKSMEEQLPSQTAASEEKVVLDTNRDAGDFV